MHRTGLDTSRSAGLSNDVGEDTVVIETPADQSAGPAAAYSKPAGHSLRQHCRCCAFPPWPVGLYNWCAIEIWYEAIGVAKVVGESGRGGRWGRAWGRVVVVYGFKVVCTRSIRWWAGDPGSWSWDAGRIAVQGLRLGGLVVVVIFSVVERSLNLIVYIMVGMPV